MTIPRNPFRTPPGASTPGALPSLPPVYIGLGLHPSQAPRQLPFLERRPSDPHWRVWLSYTHAWRSPSALLTHGTYVDLFDDGRVVYNVSQPDGTLTDSTLVKPEDLPTALSRVRFLASPRQPARPSPHDGAVA